MTLPPSRSYTGVKSQLLAQGENQEISICGMISISKQSWRRLYRVNLNEILYFPIGVREMVFAGWLIIKGFSSEEDSK